MTALETARARGIVVAERGPDERGNKWCATISRRGRGEQPPLARMVAESAEEAARMALVYVGARGWAR